MIYLDRVGNREWFGLHVYPTVGTQPMSFVDELEVALCMHWVFATRMHRLAASSSPLSSAEAASVFRCIESVEEDDRRLPHPFGHVYEGSGIEVEWNGGYPPVVGVPEAHVSC